MKTSLIVKDWHDRYRRAATPDDGADEKYIPRYTAAHRARGSRDHNGKRETEWNEPESVSTLHNGFRPKRGKVDRIRRLRSDTVKSLSALDRKRDKLQDEIHKLNKEERSLLSEAFDRSKPIPLAEIKEWESQRKAKAS